MRASRYTMIPAILMLLACVLSAANGSQVEPASRPFKCSLSAEETRTLDAILGTNSTTQDSAASVLEAMFNTVSADLTQDQKESLRALPCGGLLEIANSGGKHNGGSALGKRAPTFPPIIDFPNHAAVPPPNRQALSQDDVDDLRRLGHIAGVTYCGPWESLKLMTCARCPNVVNEVTDIEIVQDANRLTLAMLAFRPSTGQIVVSFRGNVAINNWVESLKAQLIQYPYPVAPHIASEIHGPLEVHLGFARLYSVLRNAVRATLTQMVARYPAAQIVLTGHSMGGALAHLAALDLASAFGASPAIAAERLELVTFGQPRVGNEWFAYAVERTVRRVRRFVEENDVVPHLPAKAATPPGGNGNVVGYHHAAGELYGHTGNVYLCEDGREDPACSNTRRPWNFFPTNFQFLGKHMFGMLSCSGPVY